MPIHILDPHVASQIAAGEVVERPASVVKELVENALDAGARRITIDVRGGGITELRIQDDGSGIPPGEIELAFQRHATSKLLTAEDLYAIGTLGFRGEALPSIASIAQVSCVSRIASEPVGVELRIAGGEIQSKSSVGAPVGTTFSIRNLFYNIPVRREFLRSPGAEAAAISAIVTQYALAYPQVRFSLSIDGKQRLQTSGSGLLSDVLLSIYGLEVARAMLPIALDDGGALTRVAARGLVSPPTLSRGSRDAMHLSVNGRAVAARGQVAAILDDAYHTLLMKGRFPYVVLAIEVHPAAVDVNVHPTKSEVKFRDPDRIRLMVARAIQQVVQATQVMQSWDGGSITPPPQGEQLAIADAEPEWADSERAETREERPRPPDHAPAMGAGESQREALPSLLPSTAAPTIREGESQRYEPHSPQAAQARPPEQRPVSHEPPPRVAPQSPLIPTQPTAPAWDGGVRPHMPSPPPPPDPAPVLRAPERPESRPPLPLGERPGVGGLPRLRALAQLARMYLLAEGPEGDLYLIDQHAAHERITYERLMEQRGRGAIESQRLLIPQPVVVGPAAQGVLLEAVEQLASWGFEIEEAGQALRVRSVPASVAPDEIKAALLEIADHLSGAGGSTPEAWREAMLVTLSCHTSVRTGQPLTSSEQQALIDQLARCWGPRTCPHGRPTVIVMTKQQLTRQFGRLA